MQDETSTFSAIDPTAIAPVGTVTEAIAAGDVTAAEVVDLSGETESQA